jgi:GNAT superfamily N-acetyltransferase
LVIRQAGPEDHPVCAAVFLAAYRQAFPLHPPEYYVPERYFESITGEEQWVALQTGEIIAVLSIYWPENFIHSLYVLPSLQGRGIGKRLLDAVVARPRQGRLRAEMRQGQQARGGLLQAPRLARGGRGNGGDRSLGQVAEIARFSGTSDRGRICL